MSAPAAALGPGCCRRAAELVVASVSNRGVYGAIRYLEHLTGESLFEPADRAEIYDFQFDYGAFDVVTEEVDRHEDGFPRETGEEIIEMLREV